MAQLGQGATVQFGKESTYGTAVAGAYVMNFVSESLTATPDKRDEDSLISSKAPTGMDLFSIKAGGSTSFIFRPEFSGAIVKAAFGGTDTVTTSDPVASSNKHTVITQDAAIALPSYTIIVDRKIGPTGIKKYSGGKVDSLTIDAKMGDYVRGSIDWKLKDESVGTLAALPVLAQKAYKLLGGTFTVGGVAYPVSSVTLKHSNSLVDMKQDIISGLYLPEPLHGKRLTTIDFEVPYDVAPETLYTTNYLTETLVTSIVLTMISPSMITGSTPYKITITLNNVAITSAPRNVSGPGVIMMKVSGTAIQVGATEPVQVQVWDGNVPAY
jgi:hypothetical protein